jgi:Fe-S-cluster containining protein
MTEPSPSRGAGAAGPISGPSGRHDPCATCGSCCRDYLVPVFGYDVWRIATQQRLGPEQFVAAYPQLREIHRDAFRLEREGQPWGLMLDKRGWLRPGRPCVFLFDLAGGYSRCGIYGQRPGACRVYPMVVWSGVVAERQDTLCPAGSWPLAEVVRPSWRRALQRLRMDLDVYGEVVARWNARVAGAPAGRSFALPELLAYVMDVYDRLAALDAGAGAAALAEIEASWPTVPRAPLGPAVLDAPDAPDGRPGGDEVERAPWLRYFVRARRVIDSFYPEVPPLPPQLEASLGAQPGPRRE